MTRTWKLDERCTLVRGDCRQVLARLPDRSVDFIFTDPPYGHNNNDGDLISRKYVARGLPNAKITRRPIANDGPEANDLFRVFIQHAARLLRCCCCCTTAGGGGPDPQFARWSLWMDEVMRFKHAIVWDKGRGGMGWHYRRCYEFVLVAQKGPGRCNWFTDSHSVWNVLRPGDGIRKIIPRPDQHPTEKPVELAAHFIKLHTRPGDLVLDPFAGRGATAIACLRLGRRFLGVEVDPHWFSEAKRRIRAETRPAAQLRRAA